MNQKIFTWIAIAFAILVATIIILRLLAFLYILLFCKKLPSGYNYNSKKNDDKDILDEDSLRQKLKIPKSQSQIKAEFLSLQDQKNYEVIPLENEDDSQDDIEIVGIVEPIGPWTSLILGKELSRMLRRKSSTRGGYWTNRIKADYQSNQRQRSR